MCRKEKWTGSDSLDTSSFGFDACPMQCRQSLGYVISNVGNTSVTRPVWETRPEQRPQNSVLSTQSQITIKRKIKPEYRA